MSAALACHVCGQATDARPEPRYPRTPAGRPAGQPYDVGTCDDCAALDPEQPGVAVRAALRALGKDPADWRLAAEAFEEAGVDVARVLYDGGDALTGRGARGPQRKPWAHVDRAALRAGYARLLDLRVHAAADRDRPVPPSGPPDDTPYRGCLACGLARQAEPWRGPVVTGVFTKPHMAKGYLCAPCGEALEEVGALGPTMLERAVLRARGLEWAEGMSLPGLRAWASTGHSPGEAWGHVGEIRQPEPEPTLRDLVADVAALRAEVAALREGRA